MKLLIFGSDGMVGHVVRQYLFEKGNIVSCFNDMYDLDGIEKEMSVVSMML